MLVIPVIAGNHRHARLLHERLGCVFQAHRLDGAGGRADKYQPRFLTSLREAGILREKTIARVNRLSAGTRASIENGLDAKIAFGSGRRPDPVGLVRFGHVVGIGVGVRIDRDGLEAHAPCRADDADRDLAAIGYQESFEHLSSPHIRKTPKGVSGIGAFSVAEKASARTRRVSDGAIMPSSQSRAVAK